MQFSNIARIALVLGTCLLSSSVRAMDCNLRTVRAVQIGEQSPPRTSPREQASALIGSTPQPTITNQVNRPTSHIMSHNVNSEVGLTPLMLAIATGNYGYAYIILTRSGSDAIAVDTYKRSALHHALYRCQSYKKISDLGALYIIIKLLITHTHSLEEPDAVPAMTPQTVVTLARQFDQRQQTGSSRNPGQFERCIGDLHASGSRVRQIVTAATASTVSH